jgi:uncharacterized protein
MRAAKAIKAATLGFAVGAVACLGLLHAASADEAAPAAAKPPACEGRDLSSPALLSPDDLARATEKRGDELLNGRNLLWRIEKPGLSPSYLFGTVHSTDERAVAIAKKAAEHIVGAKAVATELGGPFDKTTMMAMGASMASKAIVRDADSFAGVASPDDVAIVDKYLVGRGMNAAVTHHLRIWLLAALVSEPPCEIERQQSGLTIVDELIARTGKDLGVPVIGLETMAEQTDVLASVDPSTAATVLVSAAKRPKLTLDAYATLINLYVQQRPGDILPVFDASQTLTPEEIAAQNDFARHLLGDRNRIMAERMRPLLTAGGAFVAVGALHLVGKGGLVELLRAEGFSLTPVP